MTQDREIHLSDPVTGADIHVATLLHESREMPAAVAGKVEYNDAGDFAVLNLKLGTLRRLFDAGALPLEIPATEELVR